MIPCVSRSVWTQPGTAAGSVRPIRPAGAASPARASSSVQPEERVRFVTWQPPSPQPGLGRRLPPASPSAAGASTDVWPEEVGPKAAGPEAACGVGAHAGVAEARVRSRWSGNGISQVESACLEEKAWKRRMAHERSPRQRNRRGERLRARSSGRVPLGRGRGRFRPLPHPGARPRARHPGAGRATTGPRAAGPRRTLRDQRQPGAEDPGHAGGPRAGREERRQDLPSGVRRHAPGPPGRAPATRGRRGGDGARRASRGDRREHPPGGA